MFEATKIRNVFKSRWNAVFWSLSMLLTAYCSVPDPVETSQPVVPETVAVTDPATDALDKWKKGPHYAVAKSQAVPSDDLEQLQMAADEH
jgi:hypothetical protein